MRNALLVLPLFLAACGAIVRGNGEAETVVRNLEPSTAVRLGGFYQVDVQTDGDLDVAEVTCDSNLLPYILTEVEDGALLLRTDRGFVLSPTMDCTISVKLSQPPTSLTVAGSGDMQALGRLPDLEDVHVSGSGTLTVADGADVCDLNAGVSGSGSLDLGLLEGCALDANVSGSGSLTASGTLDDLVADISGSGDIELAELTTPTADIGVSGSGSGEFHVTDSVRVRISGSGDVTIHGNPPDRDENISGSGEIVYP